MKNNYIVYVTRKENLIPIKEWKDSDIKITMPLDHLAYLGYYFGFWDWYGEWNPKKYVKLIKKEK